MSRRLLVSAFLALAATPCLADEALPIKSGAAPATPAATTAAPVTAAPAAATTASALPDGRSLLKAYAQACGGTSALDGIDNAVVTSRYSVAAQGLEGTLTIAFARPDKIRSVGDMSGIGRIEQGFDGKTGWENNPLTGPRLLTEGEVDQLRNSEGNVFNLQSLEALYTKAETVGRKEFAGSDAWKVLLVDKSGKESTAYFDVASGLMTGLETVVETQLGEIPAVVTMSDYKTFGKLKLPATSTQSLMGGMVKAVTTIDAVDFNVAAAKLPSFEVPPEILALKAGG